MKIGLDTLGADAFQPCKMLDPILVFPPDNSGIGKLKHDVAKVLRERLASEPLDVFKNKRARLNLSHNPCSLREKITPIRHRTVLPTDGKGLAWRPPGN